MKIRRLNVNANIYTKIYIPDKNDSRFFRTIEEKFISNFQSLIDDWKIINVQKASPLKESDILMLKATNLVVKERVKDILSKYLDDTIEFLKLENKSDNDYYYLVNVLNEVNCINYEKSEFEKYEEDGQIHYDFDKYVFYSEQLEKQYLFRIPENPSWVLYTDLFKSLCEKYDIVGLDNRDFFVLWSDNPVNTNRGDVPNETNYKPNIYSEQDIRGIKPVRLYIKSVDPIVTNDEGDLHASIIDALFPANNYPVTLTERLKIDARDYVEGYLECVVEITKGIFYEKPKEDTINVKYLGVYPGHIFFLELIDIKSEEDYDPNDFIDTATDLTSNYGEYVFGLGVYDERPMLKTEDGVILLNPVLMEDEISKLEPGKIYSLEIQEAFLYSIKKL